MELDLKTVIAGGLMAGVVSLGATAATAMPLLDSKVVVRTEAPTPNVAKVYYRCGYYGCRRRYYGYRTYYRPYRYGYGYYRPHYYRPHIGIGIGGVGIGLF